MNLYIGNLSWYTTDAELRQLFEEHGEVTTCKIVTDKATNRSKGYGFVEMPNADEANAAIAAINGQDVKGREITVNEARPREDKPRTGGFRQGGGGFRNRDRDSGPRDRY